MDITSPRSGPCAEPRVNEFDLFARLLLSLAACGVLLAILAACTAPAQDFGPVVNAFEQSRLEHGAREMHRLPGAQGAD